MTRCESSTKGLYVFIIILILGSYSCRQNNEETANVEDGSELIVDILFEAGERFDPNDDFLSLPVNIGSRKDQAFIVISDRIKKGTSIEIEAIGALRISVNDTLKTYIIALPKDLNLKSMKVKDFDEFSTTYSSVKWIIEQYFLNRGGSLSTKLRSWEDERFLINYLLK